LLQAIAFLFRRFGELGKDCPSARVITIAAEDILEDLTRFGFFALFGKIDSALDWLSGHKILSPQHEHQDYCSRKSVFWGRAAALADLLLRVVVFFLLGRGGVFGRWFGDHVQICADGLDFFQEGVDDGEEEIAVFGLELVEAIGDRFDLGSEWARKVFLGKITFETVEMAGGQVDVLGDLL
jgi:hypothetical protein